MAKKVLIYQTGFRDADRSCESAGYEGIATLVKLLSLDDDGIAQATVRFGNETETYDRLINVADIYEEAK